METNKAIQKRLEPKAQELMRIFSLDQIYSDTEGHYFRTKAGAVAFTGNKSAVLTYKKAN